MEDAVVDVRRCEHGEMNVREPQCDYQGTVIPLGHTRQDNCNNCTCQVSLTYYNKVAQIGYRIPLTSCLIKDPSKH